MRFISYTLFLLAGGFTLGAGAKLTYLLALNPVIEVPRLPNIIDGLVISLTGTVVVTYSFWRIMRSLREKK